MTDSPVRRNLQDALQKTGLTDPRIVDTVMSALSEMRLVPSDVADALPLLTVPGKVLMLIIENPNLSVREIAIRMGFTEARAQRVITQLLKAKLANRVKVSGHQFRYLPDPVALAGHGDIIRALPTLLSFFGSTLGGNP